jgi:N-acetylmuramoyl-L-alanine amidase
MAGCISKPCRERSNGLVPLLGLLLVASAMGRAADNASDPATAGRVTAVRFWSLGDTTRIAIEVSSEFRFKYERLNNPDRLYFDLLGATPQMTSRPMQIIHVDDGIIKQIRVAETQPGVTRVVVDLQQPATLSTSQLANPERLMIEVRSAEAKSAKAVSSEVKPSEVKPSEIKPGEGKSSASKASGINSGGDKLNSSAPGAGNTAVAKPSPPATRDAAATPATSPSAVVMPAALPSAAPAVIPVTRTAASRNGEPLAKPTAKTASQTTSNTTSIATSNTTTEKTTALVATARVSEAPKVLESAKSSDAKPAKINSASGSRATNLEDRAESVPESPVPNPLSNSASLASNTGNSLPPEPLGVEPPYHDDLKRDDVKRDDVKHDDVREVLPAKRGTMDDRSLTRTLGLKLGRVVIDPGHGGHDIGTHGPSGYFEKDLVLDVSRRLAALIQERMSSEVVLTRSDDTYVGLEERTRIANERKADLFLSIHANSSTYRAAAGVETYVLNFTTSKSAMDLASRENAGSDLAIHDLQDLLQKIALRDKIDESRELAARLQTSLSVLSTHSNDAAKNRGVKKAPFVVLIGANMPSVLAEIGFLSNASDEALLRKPEHRQKIAEALYKGISSYADTLSQVIARKN